MEFNKRNIRNQFKGLKKKDILFVCVGTDRSTGDSLGPLTGTLLKSFGYNVIGTLDKPFHATNMVEIMETFPKNKTIIAIDACLGKSSSVGKIRIEKEPLRPGAGVGKDLPKVGDFSITGIVNVGGFMEYFVLQNTRLNLVFNLSNKIANSLHDFFGGESYATSDILSSRRKKIETKRPKGNLQKKAYKRYTKTTGLL